MNFKNLQKHRKTLLGTLVFVIIIALIIVVSSLMRKAFSPLNSDLVSVLISAIEALGLIVSLFIAISQLSDSKEIARATFIVELNKSFVENADYTNLYNKLQKCVDQKCEHSSECNFNNDCTTDDICKLQFEKSIVSNYLTFFETIYILYKKKVITFDIIDDLFAYRFFLAAHSQFVQQQKIIPQPGNFKNIFKLEKEWLEYRVRIGKIKKEDLQVSYQNKTPNTSSPKSVFTTNQLKTIIPHEVYENLTQD